MILAAVAASVQALSFNGPINADPAAMASWRGVASTFVSNPSSTHFASVQVAYAVYETSNFVNSGGFDPANGFYKYIYAYQVFNVGVSTDPVQFFKVNEGEGSGFAAYDGHKAVAGGIAPMIQPGAKFDFSQIKLTTDEHSVVLLFASNSAPSWGTAYTKSGDFAQQAYTVPVAAPEPMTIGLLGLGFAGLVRKVRK